MLCVRRLAVRLEPSNDPPEDVARAAAFVCQGLELRAINLSLDNPPPGGSPIELRATAIYYGAGQTVIARLCRLRHDCSVLPPP